MYQGKRNRKRPIRRRNLLNPVLFGCLILLTAANIIIYAAGGTEHTEPEQPSEPIHSQEAPPPLTLADIRAASFTDIAGSEPWADCVRYMACQGIMGGAGSGVFQPERLMTRSAAVTALFRMSGEEAPPYGDTFQDVQAGDWYAGALAWAVQAGLFDGFQTEGYAFGPQEPVTRA